MRSEYCAWIGAVTLVGMIGCASPPPFLPPAVDLDAVRQELMDADREFFETHTDAATFTANFALDAAFMPPGAPRVDGPSDIQGFWTIVLGQPGFSITWEATSAHVSESADLGYTIGTFEQILDDPDGNPVTTVGKYVTVWQKQADGQWKIAVDTFNADAPPVVTAEP